jgi:hypothetical protein
MNKILIFLADVLRKFLALLGQIISKFLHHKLTRINQSGEKNSGTKKGEIRMILEGKNTHWLG